VKKTELGIEPSDGNSGIYFIKIIASRENKVRANCKRLAGRFSYLIVSAARFASKADFFE
jgi:UDP-3-O-acyl-N-acetylglucosamine deacetylase